MYLVFVFVIFSVSINAQVLNVDRENGQDSTNMVTKFAFKIGKHIDFAGISYLQFPINKDFLNPRWVFDSNLYFEFSKRLNFLLRYDFNYDEYRPLPIDDFYYSLNFGVQVKI